MLEMNSSYDFDTKRKLTGSNVNYALKKLAEIKASKLRIANQTREIFHPTETDNGTNALMSNFSSGITILNGVITGFKIIKRIRNLFR
jgi:hypothetical protein